MSKSVKQYRFYQEGSSLNYPVAATIAQFASGDVFNQDDIFPVAQLGIQSVPGTKFYLNNNTAYPMVLGTTGIYDLSISNGAEVTSILFDVESLNNINKTESAYLIIDVLYGED